MTTAIRLNQENHTRPSFFKTATMAIVFFNAVSFSAPIVHPLAQGKETTQEPSFSMQKIGYTPVVENVSNPTFSVSNNPIKELIPMGAKERIIIPFREEKVAAPSSKLEDEVYNFAYEKPSAPIVKERISIPFRKEISNSPIGSEFI